MTHACTPARMHPVLDARRFSRPLSLSTGQSAWTRTGKTMHAANLYNLRSRGHAHCGNKLFLTTGVFGHRAICDFLEIQTWLGVLTRTRRPVLQEVVNGRIGGINQNRQWKTLSSIIRKRKPRLNLSGLHMIHLNPWQNFTIRKICQREIANENILRASLKNFTST